MIQIKKTILTLVALLAVTTGAWADETLLLTIESKDYTTFTSGSKTFDEKVTITFSGSVYNDGDTDGWYSGGTASLLTVTGTNGYTITSCKFYTNNGPANTGYTVEGESPSVYLYGGKVYIDDSKSVSIGTYGVTKIEVYTAAASVAAVEVAWTAASKTGTFKMPGGNVELEPEYYPQATAVEGAVVSMENLQATVDAELVTFDANGLTGSTSLMYYVSETATAPAYDAQGWTDKVPNAKDFTEACNRYVYYYLVGDDEHSDGDICANALYVTIAAAPTYAVTFADGLAEPTKWTASPNTGVTKGQPVTVTYTGSKKVLGVKAEKKAATAEGHALADAVVGDIVGSDGKFYAVADKDKLPEGVTAVAVMAKGGTAIALTDESGMMDWNTAQTTCSAKTAVPGGTWGLVSVDKWNSILSYNGGNMNSYTGLNTTITAAGGTALQEGNYWSLTEYYADNTQAYTIKLSAGSKSNETKAKTEPCRVRAVLEF